VTSCCLRDGKEAVEARYYISSLEVGVERFARSVRGHWSVENGCHWVLDMTFREDESRRREQRLRENFAWLNRFALSLLKQHPGRQSLVMKRCSCGWSDAFLMEVVTGSTC
jgi:predicted transposase YbfD/YdcC